MPNGLKLLVQYDPTTPMTAVNTMYNVGARDEDPSRTGFAHLFEHLMFGGSLNIPQYDTPLQRAAGQNNAFTNNDITNYYITLPAANIDTALWLESDRMLSLAFTPQSLEVQRKVVVEEFAQRYLNQPYGDLWLKLRPLAYREHPYRWATIGQSVAHIEQATLDHVKEFFHTHYHPGNAILAIAGPLESQHVYEKVLHWYGDIPGRALLPKSLPHEPEQREHRLETIHANVPQQALHLAWHMPGRLHPDYPAYDLCTDILSQGQSARLQLELVRKRQLFTSINCYLLGSIDPGLVVVSGMLTQGTNHDVAKAAVLEVLHRLASDGCTAEELQKVQNKFAANHMLSEVNVLSRALNLAWYELLGSADMMALVLDEYMGVTADQVRRVAQRTFADGFYSELRYAPTAPS